MNYKKSTVLFSSNTIELERALITRELGVHYSKNSKKYLGLPNVVGKEKKDSFLVLKDRMKKHIDSWSTWFLSEEGKEVFIKVILQAIPTYAMSCFLLPRVLCDEMESIVAQFWRQKSHNKRGIHWCD